MRILNKYVRERAPLFIPLSPSCREEILASKASSAVIFDRARQEVMMRLGGGKVAYCVSLHTHLHTTYVYSEVVCFAFTASKGQPVVTTTLFLHHPFLYHPFAP